jgi:tRNA1(Val) A37 N6-methylase TrmN6
MRAHGQAKLGFYPLPLAEANRLGRRLNFPEQFSALDPCVGDGVAFSRLLRDAPARRYGIEIDAYRAEQARTVGIETLQANAMDVRCSAETVSLPYLNPPYDWEAGAINNQRLESVFLEHTYRWLKPGGVLLFVIPQPRLAKCARLLSEQFAELRVFRLREPACLQYKQIVVLATRRKRPRDSRMRHFSRRCDGPKNWQPSQIWTPLETARIFVTNSQVLGHSS